MIKYEEFLPTGQNVETVVQLSKGDIDKGSSGRSDAIEAGNIGIGQ